MSLSDLWNQSLDDNRKLSIKSFFRLSPLKMDFNQVSARGLRRMMRNVIRRSADKEHVDVVLIGHSKTFVPYNEKTLEPFLKFIYFKENKESAVACSNLWLTINSFACE